MIRTIKALRDLRERENQNLLHRRKHPTGMECHDEYVQGGLELIAKLENGHKEVKEKWLNMQIQMNILRN